MPSEAARAAAGTSRRLRAKIAALDELLVEAEDTALRNAVALEERAADLALAKAELEARVDELIATRERLLAAEQESAAHADEIARAHAAAREALDLLLEVHRTVPCALIVFRGRGLIQSVNDAACALLGYSEAELVGSRVGALFAPGEAPTLGQLERASGADGVLRDERTCLAKNGALVPVLFSARLLLAHTPHAEPRVVCVALDLRERRKLEVELRQAQKLESVGRLAAGVAHEINTPVQFVSDNVHFLRDAVRAFADLIGGYRELLGSEPALAPLRARAAELEARADLDFLLADVPQAIESSLDGLSRIATIVRSMKEFAHPDQAEMAAADLNRAIETTLTIARGEYKYVADVHTEFGDLPPVTCNVGELNQVFLNLLVNAAHAIADVVGDSGARGLITLSTVADGQHVEISVADTGTGIPDAVRAHIFEPFFTTKEVGRGTGQGLAMARAVVEERHGGTLRFETELGRGTTFVLRLPLTPPTTNRRPGTLGARSALYSRLEGLTVGPSGVSGSPASPDASEI